MGSRARYDVFLTYRVKDSLELVDPLCHRIIEAGICVFRDDDELSIGEEISPAMRRAIEDSEIYVPIFSKNYASSPWCLRELAYMVRLRFESDRKKVILPIFYDVQPSDVDLRTSLNNEDLLKPAERFDSDDLGQWWNDLTEEAETKGHVWDGKPKSLGRLVDLVVEEVLHRLKLNPFRLVLPEHLVGMDVRVQAAINRLDAGGDGVHFLGILGMGGVGKTVLAKAVFNQLFSRFEGRSFVSDIRERSQRASLVACQEQLLYDILPREPPSVHSVDEGIRLIRERLSNKKVLLLLDDIGHWSQLEALAGDRDWFGRGSRIIITTRNRDVLRVAYPIPIYEMGSLNDGEAFNLFNMHAFQRGLPPEDWYALSREAVSMLGGLPLALEVLGSLLRGRSKEDWQATLKELKVKPYHDIKAKLKISYDALDDRGKEIFLDIACFFINKNVTDAIYMWDDCGFLPRLVIDQLVGMSLIKIVDDHTIWMHDQLIDLGRKIIEQESPEDPGNRSRVWHHKQAPNLKRSKRKKLPRVEALSLAENPPGSVITNEDLAWLPNLRFLELEGAILDGDFKNLLQELRYLSWRFCPEEFTATSLYLGNLVVLNLSEGHITDNWGGWSQIKVATKLKVLDLTGCQGITRMPDLSGVPRLERLLLCYCLELCTVDSSIVKLQCLTYLNLKGCINLQGSLKEIGALVDLEYLCLEGCSKLTELPSEMGNLKALLELNISDTGIRVLPDSLQKLKELKVICSEKDKSSLLSAEEPLKELKVMRSEKDKFSLLSAEEPKRSRDKVSEKIEGVSPNRKGRLSFLTALKLSDSSESCILTIPTMIIELVNLLTLDLEDCNKLQQLPKLPKSLEHLKLPLYLRPVLNILDLIKEVDFLLFDGSEDLSFHASTLMLTSVQWIKKLNKQGNLESCLADILAASIKSSSLSCLNQLSLLRQGVQSLVWLSSFLSVLASGDLCLTKMWSYISSFKNSSNLWIYQYEHEEIQLTKLEGLRKLTLENCEHLQRVSNLSIWKSLKELRLIRCPNLVELQNLGGFESLEKLHVKLCQSMERLSGLSSLRKLDILIIEECGALRVVEGLDELDSLSSLKMWNCSMLKRLTDVSNSKIPDGCEVIIWNCGALRDFGYVGCGLPYKHYREAVLGNTDRDSRSDLAKRPGKMSDMESQGSGNLEESMEKMKDEGGQRPVGMATSYRNYAIAAVHNVVGIDDRAKQIIDLMEMEVNDEVRIIGIYGADGIGKTTLAKAVYNLISSCFDSRSFLAEVEESAQDATGIQCLQTKLIRDILERDRDDPSFDERIEDFLDIFRERKVLIVVDDVKKQSHFREIVGELLHWFRPGSRIIVTSENEEILREYDTEKTRTYTVRALDDGQAFELFCEHAFRMQSSIPDYDGLANCIVNATEKLPLAVEVVGSFLQGKSKREWEKMEESMKARLMSSQRATVGLEEILDICYNGLNDQQKEIFLDIACFISGVDTRIASCMWPSTYRPSSGCILMPLAKIGENNELQMHRLPRCLGKRILKQEESQDPRSIRFCTQDMVLKGMNRETGVGALCSDFTARDFQSMPNLRFLKLDGAKISGDFEGAFPSLRGLCWQRYPPEFDAENLVLGELAYLNLSWSKVTEDWGGWKKIKMEKLKVLNLTGCSDLLFSPDFSGYQYLEILILEGCSRLVKLDPSIGLLKRLVSLNLKSCSRLNSLPVEMGGMTALKELFIDGTSVQGFPISIGNLKKLEILSGFQCFPLTQLPRSICYLIALSELSFDGAEITELPSSLGDQLKLRRLLLRNCRYLKKLPDSIGNMGSSLEELDISVTCISELPDSIRNLVSLKVLRMDYSFVRAFPGEIGNLTKLEVLHASWCRSLKGAVPREIKRLHHLRSLTLGHSSISSLPSEISTLSSLHTLDLLQCNEIEVLPQLPSSLICLRVSSTRMKAIPILKDLKELEELCLSDEDPKGCRPPSERPMPESDLQHPLRRWFSRLWNLEFLQPNGKQSFLISCPKLRKLEFSLSQIIKLKFEPTDVPQLKTLTLSGLSLKEVTELPNTLSVFELYHSVIEEIEGLEGFQALRRLDISNCNIQNLNGIGQLTSLRSLVLSDCDDLSLPDLSNLQSLKVLEIRRCKMIRQIDGLEKLTSLQKLNVSECPALNSLQVQNALKDVMARSPVS